MGSPKKTPVRDSESNNHQKTDQRRNNINEKIIIPESNCLCCGFDTSLSYIKMVVVVSWCLTQHIQAEQSQPVSSFQKEMTTMQL